MLRIGACLYTQSEMLCCSYHLIIFKRVPTELELKYPLYVLVVYVFIKAGVSV